MRASLLVLCCTLTVGCGGGEAPPQAGMRPPASDPGTLREPVPAGGPSGVEQPSPEEEQPVTVEGRGTVLAARETPQNKRFPDRGGHWILELAIEEWSAGDGRPQPEGPLRLIVPRELIDAMMPAPAVGERLSLTARLVVDKPNTARAAALMRVASDDSE